MTQSEKDSLRDYIVSYLIANSQTVNNLPDVTSLSGISSFPVIQQINGSNYIAKKVPFDMMITDFRYDFGYIQYKDLTTGNWINIISDEELASKIDLTNYVKLSDNQIVDGIKSFIKSPIVPTPINNSDAANKQYIDSINELSVHLIGDEVVEGIKTFSSSPIIPTPTIDMQASTKKYVDDISNEKFDKSSISQSTGQNITQVMSQKSTTDSLAGKADLIDGKIPAAQLPSYVDDVLEAVNVASFPSIGESGKIYVDTTTNITYRWTGSVYTEISKSLALGETSSSAYRGDRGKTAYDHSQIITGNPHNTKASDIANTTNGTISSTNVQAAINELDSDIDQVRADLNEIETDLNQKFGEINDFDSLPSRFGWLGASTFSLLQNSKHKIISLKGGETIKIIGNSFYTTSIYLVKSYTAPTINTLSPEFATGETGRRVIGVDGTLEVIAPIDARYLVVGISYDGVQNNVPKLIAIDNFNITIGTKKEIIDLKSEVSDLEDSVSDLNYDIHGVPYIWTLGVVYANGNIGSGTQSNYYSQIIPNGLINNRVIDCAPGYIYNFAYYTNGVFVSRGTWQKGINTISTQYDIRILIASNAVSSYTIEQLLPNFTLPIIVNSIENRLNLLENKSELSDHINYMNKINCSDFDGKTIHFSFDDVCWALYDLIQNGVGYTSLFESPFFAALKTIHDNTGSVFTLNTFNTIINTSVYYPSGYNIAGVPSKFQSDFQANKSWLKFAFHGENEVSNYNTSTGILGAYNTFVAAIYQLTGDYDCIDKITRLGYFGGSLANCISIKNAEHGVVGFLGADDSRAYDYYLTPDQYDVLRKKGKYADLINELFFIKTQTRSITPAVSFETIIESNPCYQKFTEVFAHEYEYYGYGNALKTMITNFTTIAAWANTKGYLHYYPSLIIG